MLSDEVSTARKRIFRDGYDISFGELVSLYDKKELIIQPEYQRLFRWNETQKTRFIESLILNIPIPPIFVFSDEKGRWELVDGLQRVSTVLEFIGKLDDGEGKLRPAFTCDGTVLVPSLKGSRWPTQDEEDLSDSEIPADVLPLSIRLSIRRARIRVEILGQETDAHAKYELFQRLNSGGTNLSEQELRNCIIISINRAVFENIKVMAENEDFMYLAEVGAERARRQYLNELVVRFIVLRHHKYLPGLDVHEYLDQGIINVAENKMFDWQAEFNSFSNTMDKLRTLIGKDAFDKSNRFSLGMYEFITLGLSKNIDRFGEKLNDEFVKKRVLGSSELPEAKKYSGIGVRGTQRLASFVVPMAEKYFKPSNK
jgi:hypothetical protein